MGAKLAEHPELATWERALKHKENDETCLPLFAAPALWWTAWPLHWMARPPASLRAYSWNCVDIQYLEKDDTIALELKKVSAAANRSKMSRIV